MRPEFGLTQYCFGEVVLTLNATAELFGLVNMNNCLDDIVKGPISLVVFVTFEYYLARWVAYYRHLVIINSLRFTNSMKFTLI